MKKGKKFIEAVLALIVVALGLRYTVGTEEKLQSAPLEAETVNVAASLPEKLEIPAITGADDHIVEHEAYTSSYNTTTLIPNWVAYELTEDEIEGETNRDDKIFQMDPDLSRTRQAMREDYSGSGWTKGHMTPAADARWSDDAVEETFYFTNICPQDETLNGGDWQYLEKQVRNWARRYGSAYVVSGPIIGENIYGTIGERHVTVPDAFFKVVLVNTGSAYHSIAFVMTNDDSRQFLRDCALSVNSLEEMTGIDFFPGLEDSIEDQVEAQLRFSDWGIK